MSFIQIIDYETKQPDQISRLNQEWVEATEGRRTALRSVVGRDRNNPNRYVVMVEFDSYEEAMRNSKLPETSAMAEKIAALCTSPATFTDLDVVDVMTP